MADTGQDTDRVQFELVSPTRLVLSEAVDMVVVPGAEGDFGVLPGHTPLIATVRPGVIDIHQDGEITKRLFVEGGFAEAAPERCTVLTKSAQPVEEMDSQAASQRMEAATKALEDLTGDEGRESAEAELIAAQAMADAAG
ncbi:MAG: F0F1 ATP synthase subunit epsilon [Rhodospirillales bacterium]|jgi:F-type H+-transporting ATPase subunit epsilon|nr:F0F1 ATP synthase subunit epsilon [Rhodospirillales bacterium]